MSSIGKYINLLEKLTTSCNLVLEVLLHTKVSTGLMMDISTWSQRAQFGDMPGKFFNEMFNTTSNLVLWMCVL